MFIDIHTHILPGVDDGAETLEEALELLTQEKEQGVDAVICTPHFYPEALSLEEHMDKTNVAFKQLQQALSGLDLPEVFLGYEVHCYPQIARSSGLECCTINGTYYLLLELPFLSGIPAETIGEIIRLSEDLGFRVIIAHIERYATDRQYQKLISLVKKGVVLAQINADSFFIPQFKKAVDKLLKRNLVSFVASDAHSKEDRPVRIRRFLDYIKFAYPIAYRKILNETDLFLKEIKGDKYA